MTPSSSIEQTEYYRYVIDIDFYNSSGEIKITRNIEVVFMNGKKNSRQVFLMMRRRKYFVHL